MDIKTTQQIIDNSMPILTGLLSAVLIFFSEQISFLETRKELIPIVVSVVVTAISVLLILNAKRKTEEKRDIKNKQLEKTISDNIDKYTKILNDSKVSSAAKEKIEGNLIQLMEMSVDMCAAQKKDVDLMNGEINVADELISNAMKKINEANKKEEKGD